MNILIERLDKIKSNISKVKDIGQINIIAVSKTFSLEYIKPVIESGHLHFGENKVQEAETKWLAVKKTNKNIQLHMIGKLQSNSKKSCRAL